MKRTPRALLAASAVVAATVGCDLALHLDDYTRAADDGGTCRSSADCSPESDCVLRECVDGACRPTNAAAGKLCNDEGGKMCDGKGSCVGCLVDGELDGAETDVDCGGGDCAKCALEKRCKTGADCASGNCRASSCNGQPCMLCKQAGCKNGVRDGDETGVDCGGKCTATCVQGESCATKCAQGDACNTDDDCQTNHCADHVCCGVPCGDACRRCSPSTGACVFVAPGDDPDDECPQNDCDGAGQCTQCSTGLLEPPETDVDCGGGVCAKCKDGRTCQDGARDCTSCLCEAGICAEARCGNGERDGCESDTDCGGACGATCLNGQQCNGKADCISGSCISGVCK